MCAFCQCTTKIETTIGENELIISLDEENKNILNVRLPLRGGVEELQDLFILNIVLFVVRV